MREKHTMTTDNSKRKRERDREIKVGLEKLKTEKYNFISNADIR